MKKNMLKGLLATAFVVLSLFSAAVIAQNNEGGPGNGFRVSPVREELTIQPGQSQTVEITVENVTSAPIVAHPVINNFEPSDKEDGEPRLLLDGDSPGSGNDFRSLVSNIPNIPLKAGERKNVPVTINVPGNAAGGGYYGAIRFSPSEIDDELQVSLTASVGVIFLIKVPGNITERLELQSLSAGRDERSGSLFFNSPDKTVIRLKNTGTIHLQPFGRIQVKDWRGNVISNEEFNNSDPRSNILPNSIRRFETPLNAKASFGRYRIEANLGYGTEQSELISASTTFWVLPIWFLATVGVLIALIVAAIIFWRAGRRKRRRYR